MEPSDRDQIANKPQPCRFARPGEIGAGEAKKCPVIGGDYRARTIRSETLRTFILNELRGSSTGAATLGGMNNTSNLSIGHISETSSGASVILKPIGNSYNAFAHATAYLVE